MERAILHVVKRNNFGCPFLMHLARQKVQMTFFSRKMKFRKEQTNCSFCGESHSSCSQKEFFFCPFLMHLARQKVQMTFFSTKTTLRKENKNCSFRGESHSSCSQKEQFFVVLFWCIWQGKKYKLRSFLERWCSEKNQKFFFFLWWEQFFM